MIKQYIRIGFLFVFSLISLLVLSCKKIRSDVLYLCSNYEDEPAKDTFKLSKESNFLKALQAKDTAIYNFKFSNGENSSVFLTPGRYHLNVNMEEEQVHAPGKLKIVNQILKEAYHSITSVKRILKIYLFFDNKKSSNDLNKIIDYQMNRITDRLNDQTRNNKIDKKILAYLNAYMQYSKLCWKFEWSHDPILNKTAPLLDYTKDIDHLEQPKYLNLKHYQETLVWKIKTLTNIELAKKPSDSTTKIRLDIARNTFKNSEIRNFATYAIMNKYLDWFHVENTSEIKKMKETKELIAYFESINNNLDQRKKIDLRYAKLRQTIMGKAAATFSYANQNGKIYQLDDFKGKVLYLDIWASWCGPCTMEIPYLKSLEQTYKNKNVAFVSISLDEKRKAWERALERHNLEGIQLLAQGGFDSKIAQDYQIKGIPRFILIDAKGHILQSNAPRPSETIEVRQAIDEALLIK